MTNKTPLLFLLALLLAIQSFGAAIDILGKVVASTSNEPIVYASVGYYTLPDSNYIAGTATNMAGDFKLSAEHEMGYLKVTFISYETQIIELEEGVSGNLNLGTIKLSQGVTSLSEIAIEGEKSEMNLQLDKRVFNVGKDLGTTGGNAQDVLQNIPSVNVDEEGNVGLRGSNNVRILINGQPSGLVGIDPATALEQIPSSLIERVEIITNPSARYDAEGEVGIINIVLKKEEQKGLNGSIELKTGVPDNHGAAALFNYRRNRVNYFGSYSIGYRNSPGFGYSYQEFFNSDSLSAYQRNRDHSRGGLNQTARLGAEFKLNERNTLSVSGLYKNGMGRNKAQLVYKDFGPENEVISQTTRREEEQEPENNVEFSLSHFKAYEKKGKEWSSEFRFIQNDETELANIEESYDSGLAPLFQRTSNTEDELNYIFRTDFVQPIKSGKIELGAKSSNRIINNDFLVEQRITDTDWKALNGFDNHFVYTERIQAAYAMISGSVLNRMKYQAGLRAEHSDITTELLQTNEVNRRTYLNLFPSAHLTYEMTGGKSLQLSYSRRLSRPRFRHLLPFYGFSDNRNFYMGNPDLDPEFTHAVEASFMKYWNKGSFLGSIYHRHRTGVIERISYADENGIVYRVPVNLATKDATGLELSGNYDPFKWWRLNGSMNVYSAVTRGEYEGNNLYAEVFTFKGRLASNLKLFDRYNLQTSFSYDAPKNNTQGKTLARYGINFGLSHRFWDDNATLTFSGQDILNSRRYRWTTETDEFFSESDFMWRVRTFTLTFQYRIKNYKGEKRRSGKGFEVNDNVQLD